MLCLQSQNVCNDADNENYVWENGYDAEYDDDNDNDDDDMHPKSKNVCGFCFSVQKNLQKKWVNFHNKIARQKCIHHRNSTIFTQKRA